MSDYKMPPCARTCLKAGTECLQQECRMWVDYGEDQNCSLISIYKNGPMTLDEVSKRIGVSLVRISQIEKKALKKLSKKIKL